MPEQRQQQPATNGGETETHGTLTRRQELFAYESNAIVETASAAVAMQARAAVEARYVVAMRNPRDIEEVRQAILRACRRPEFADEAIYSLEFGDETVEDFSIRFAETAILAMRNIETTTMTIYDHPRRRIVRVAVTDLEANVPYAKDVVIEKAVERRNATGREVISQRKNKYNKDVFRVVATDDEIAGKEAALLSKAIRTQSLRLIPADIKAEARRTIDETLKNRAAKDPDAERKQVADAFATLNIRPTDLREYLGHALDQSTPAELVKLRKVFASLRDGEAVWADIMEDKRATATATKDATEKKTEDLKKEHAEKKGGTPSTPATDTRPAGPDTKIDDCGCPDFPAGIHLAGCPHAKPADDAGDDATGDDNQNSMFPGMGGKS